MLITIPTKTEDSLGIEKSDNVPEGVTLDPEHYTTAAQLEAMKTALIAHATALADGVGGLKHNLSDPDPPDETDNRAEGYAAGSIWIVDVDDIQTLYVCSFIDDSDAATWSKIPLVGGASQPVGRANSSGASTTSAAAFDHVHKGAPLTEVGTIAGTTHTLETADDGKVYRCTNAAGCTILVPEALVAAGVTAEFVQQHATGQVVIDQQDGMQLRYPASFLAQTAEQWSSVVVTILDDTNVLIRGDLEAA